MKVTNRAIILRRCVSHPFRVRCEKGGCWGSSLRRKY